MPFALVFLLLDHFVAHFVARLACTGPIRDATTLKTTANRATDH